MRLHERGEQYAAHGGVPPELRTALQRLRDGAKCSRCRHATADTIVNHAAVCAGCKRRLRAIAIGSADLLRRIAAVP